MVEFQAWPKIARLNRNITITEKIDGTNAAIHIDENGDVFAQSRTRLITPKEDNFGFAHWAYDNAEMLRETLGHGIHFGEWWGLGIQRGYEQTEKHFSLFNTAAWGELLSPTEGALRVTPVLYEGLFSENAIKESQNLLRYTGSQAAPGYDKPEGIVIFHHASREMYKVTLEKDEAPKGQP